MTARMPMVQSKTVSIAAVVLLTLSVGATSRVLAQPVVSSGEFFGGDVFAPAVRFGLWDFDRYTEAQQDSVDECAFGQTFSFGEILDPQGWIPSPESNVLPRVERMDEDWIDEERWPDAVDSENVGGGVIAYYEPRELGFVPGQLSLMESPFLDLESLGIEVAPLSLIFCSNSNPDPALLQLEWIVGIRAFDGGVWGPWLDATLPMQLGPASYEVPFDVLASVVQFRVGIRNPSDVLIRGKGAASDKKKGKTEPVVASEHWKYIPDIKQEGATCAAAATADCLAWFASNGYPEIMPAATDTTKKHNKLRDALKKSIYGDDEKPGGTGKDADDGDGFIKYLKEKKVFKGTQVPGDARKPLVHKRYTGPAAKWDSLVTEHGQDHDVMIDLNWYKADGTLIEVPVAPGSTEKRTPAHGVTVGGVVRFQGAGGKKVIHVSNPWGDQTDEVNSANRDKAYDQLEAEVDADGRIKVKNAALLKKFEKEGAAYLCVSEIEVIKPEPTSFAPAPLVADLSGIYGEGQLVTHGYAIQNTSQSAIDYLALVIDVPFENVESPPGWTWEPLPASYPGAVTCDQRVGPYGIAWRTTTHPVQPGDYRNGFRFQADEQYMTFPAALGYYEQNEDFMGEYGFVQGPSAQNPSSTPPIPHTRLDSIRLRTEPNPVADVLTVHFTLPERQMVRLDLFDTTGRKLHRLASSSLPAGEHVRTWDRRDDTGRLVPSGVYFLRLAAGAESVARRLVILE